MSLSRLWFVIYHRRCCLGLQLGAMTITYITITITYITIIINSNNIDRSDHLLLLLPIWAAVLGDA